MSKCRGTCRLKWVKSGGYVTCLLLVGSTSCISLSESIPAILRLILKLTITAESSANIGDISDPCWFTDSSEWHAECVTPVVGSHRALSFYPVMCVISEVISILGLTFAHLLSVSVDCGSNPCGKRLEDDAGHLAIADKTSASDASRICNE